MNDVQTESEEVAAGSFELTDCGQASKVTRGLPIVLFFELGNPPFNKLFLI